MPPERDWSRRPLSLLLALLVAASASLMTVAGVFVPVEDALTAKRAELLTRPPTGETTIVEIDARSLAELRSWPWPRRYHADVVRQLSKSGASVIAFDVDFSARSGDGDEQLSAAIHAAGHVILPIFAQKASANQSDPRILSSRPDPAFASAWVGGVNIFPDRDGVVREYAAATFIDGAVQPSIATLLAEKNGLADRTFQPDWAIEADAIPRVSFADVMNGRVPASTLRGKRVLIGATAIELGDRYAVPRYGVVPGVVVQALATESLLQDRAILRTGLVATLAGILAIAFAFAPRALRRPKRYAAICCALLAVLAAGPAAAQSLWPITVDSAAWIFTLCAAVAVQAGLEARRRLRYRTQFDADSGLPNRSVLEKELTADAGSPRVIVAAAIERFDAIRDGMGLAATNELIRACAERVSALAGTAVYRIAPDVLAWTQVGDAQVEYAIGDIQSAFREPVATGAGPVDVILTFGLERRDGAIGPVLPIEHALAAIGSARTLGKTHDWYRGAEIGNRRQLSMMGELRHAMENGGLRLAYQPKMAIATGAIGDAEALIRWTDEKGETVSPDEFIPLAEATGVIREVTMFALRGAISDLKRWGQHGNAALRVAVNVSALDLAADDFVGEVTELLDSSEVPSSQLTIEVTESALIRSPAAAIATLSKLRALGLRLAVDDYGTGQSTLSYLKHLPVHELKIDKSFVTSVANSESDAIMVRSTIDMAHQLGLEVVAEGIEDQATLDLLRELGCDYAQGYFISKPVPQETLIELVSAGRDVRRVA